MQQKQDNEIRAIIEIFQDKSYSDYNMCEDLLYYFKDGRNLLVIPKSMEIDVIKAIHEKGHFAAKRTEEFVWQEYYIRDLRKKVEYFIINCVPCILINRKQGKKVTYTRYQSLIRHYIRIMPIT